MNLTSLIGVIDLYVVKAFKRVTAFSFNYTEANSSVILKEIVLNSFKRVIVLIKKRVEGWKVRERLRVHLKVNFNQIRLIIVILFSINCVDGSFGACIAGGVVEGLHITCRGVFSHLRIRLARGNVRVAFTYLSDDEFRETASIDVVVCKRSRLQEMRVQLTLRFVVGLRVLRVRVMYGGLDFTVQMVIFL